MNLRTEHGLQCRWLIRRDMPDVLQIDGDSWPAIGGHWDEDEWMRHLKQRNCIGMVVEDERCEIVGAMCYELHPHHLEIVRLCGPTEPHNIVLRTMIHRLVKKLSQQRRRKITTIVNDYALAAQVTLRSCGFLATAGGEWIPMTYGLHGGTNWYTYIDGVLINRKTGWPVMDPTGPVKLPEAFKQQTEAEQC